MRAATSSFVNDHFSDLTYCRQQILGEYVINFVLFKSENVQFFLGMNIKLIVMLTER